MNTVGAAMVALAAIALTWPQESACAENFTSAGQDAKQYGTHELVLQAQATVNRPFDASCQVQLTMPDGRELSIDSFYDGANIWRARVYVAQRGRWSWRAECSDIAPVHAVGTFNAVTSTLRGKLRPHDKNPRQWMTDDGRWFLNVSDTGYRLFNQTVANEDFRAYVAELQHNGFSSVRVAALGGWLWARDGRYDGYDVSNWPWADREKRTFDLNKFRTSDRRLIYLLNNHPDLYVQLIALGMIEWNTEKNALAWARLPAAKREQFVRYMTARFSAFPSVFWLLINDMHVGRKHPGNVAFARDAGTMFARFDPWRSLLAAGPAREQVYPFTGKKDRQWSTYIHIETNYNISASHARLYDDVPLHVFNAEDRYEQDYPLRDPQQPAYFYRRLFWSWLLSGGSSNYGGRHIKVVPPSRTGSHDTRLRDHLYTRPLRGTDGIRVMAHFVKTHAPDLALWRPADELVSNGAGLDDSRRAKCLAAAANDGFLVYMPNAANIAREENALRMDGRFMAPDPSRRPGITIDLRKVGGTFRVHWLRPRDGQMRQDGAVIHGGAKRTLRAPWQGEDAVLWLEK